MAMPARMSGTSRSSPRRRRGPSTIARCGSHRTTSAPMRTSLSVKIRRFSNIHSWISTEPSLCAARATAMLLRSAGGGGGRPRGRVVDLGLVLAHVPLDRQTLATGDDDVLAVELRAQAEALEH